MAYGGGGCILNSLYSFMMTVRAYDGIHGNVDGCVIVSIDTSLDDEKK